MGWRCRRCDFALPDGAAGGQPFSVKIEAEDACGRFTARVLRDVTIGESRDWFAGAEVATYFGLLEQKMISNAVDATNFAWLAMGQPTHAFDLDKIEGGIIVRRARKGERLKTLDGVERVLDADDLVVADHTKALGLAGVMGGWDTMITPETKNVLVEAAWFDPMAVRQTARRHGLHTDASHRFERGADFNAAPVASALVSAILLANGGWIEGELVDVRVAAAEERTARRKPIALAAERGAADSGRDGGRRGNHRGDRRRRADGAGMRACSTTCESGGRQRSWQVTLPSWRLDLEREIDLIEEVARVYGYNRFANTLPAFGEGVRALPWAEKEAAVRGTMLAAGFHEAIGSTFCSAAEGALTAPQPALVVPLGNPLSEEAGVLRPSLVPGMLAMIAGNLNRDVSDVRLFELGTVFSGAPTWRRWTSGRALAFGAVGSLPEESALHAGAGDRLPRYEGRGGAGAGAVRDARDVLRSLSRRGRTHAGVAASVSRGARGGRWRDGGLVRATASARGRGAQDQGRGAGGRALSRPALQAAAAQAGRRGRSRASSRCGAIFRWFWTRALRGKRSIARWRVARFPSWWSGACARCFAMRGWARASMRCCWARHSRRRIARCARRSCRASRRRWWKLLARRERGCASELNIGGDPSIYSNGTKLRRRSTDVRDVRSGME